MTSRLLFSPLAGLIFLLAWLSPAGASPFQFGVSGEVIFPDTIGTFNLLSELELSNSVKLRATLGAGSLFGVWLLSASGALLLESRGDLTGFLGLEAGLVRLESDFGTNMRRFLGAVIGGKMKLGAASLLVQIRLTNLIRSRTYQLGLGVLFR